jgi:hypothetical protein
MNIKQLKYSRLTESDKYLIDMFSKTKRKIIYANCGEYYKTTDIYNYIINDKVYFKYIVGSQNFYVIYDPVWLKLTSFKKDQDYIGTVLYVKRITEQYLNIVINDVDYSFEFIYC